MSSREGQMALSNCLLCLQNSIKVPPQCLEFSTKLFETVLSEHQSQVNRFEPASGMSFLFCSRCRVYLMKFAKLNDQLTSLVSRLRQLQLKQIAKITRISSLQAQIGRTDNKDPADVYCDTNTACNSNSKFKDQLDKVEDRTVPRNVTRQKLVGSVQQVSEKDFIFKGKYPFERTEFRFKCGSCPAVCKFTKRKGLPIWYSMMAHMKTWHIGSGRIRKVKTPQPFIEIAPDRFQYGKYLVEKKGDKYECITCNHLAAFGPRKDKFKYIRAHIRRQHESKFRNTTRRKFKCDVCGMNFTLLYSLTRHKKSAHESS